MEVKRIRRIDSNILNGLKRFLIRGQFNEIEASVLRQDLIKSVIYPTDDFHLDESQFYAIKSLLSETAYFYVLQMGFDTDGFFSENRNVYVCSRDITFSEYRDIWLDSISIVAPSSWEWVVLIDEAPEGGLGLFLSSKECVNTFNRIYEHTLRDTISFVEFFMEKRAKGCRPLEYMMEILRLCKD